MFKSRFFWQLYSGYVVLVLVFAAIVGLAVSEWVVEDAQEGLRETMRSSAVVLGLVAAPALEGAEQPGLHDEVRRFGSETGTRLTVIAADGRPLADSEEDPAVMSNHRTRPEIELAARQGEGVEMRFSDTVGRRLTYLALRVPRQPDQPLKGFVRAALPADLVSERLSQVRGLVTLGAAIASIIALVIGLFITRRITQPIKSMTEVAKAMAAGDYGRLVEVEGSDEVGVLADAFNGMARQLAARIDTITKDRNALQTIFGGMIEGVVAVDTEERLLHMNGVAAELLEVDPRASLGGRIWELARVQEISDALGQCLRDGREFRTEARVMVGADEAVLEINAAPLRDGSGELVGAVVVFHDVTDIRRLELIRREFVINASHELKTPITAIRGFLDTLQGDPTMPAEIRDRFISRAGDQAGRLADLVTDLLRLSRLETASGQDEAEHLDLRQVATTAVKGLASVAREKQLDLVTELAEREVEILAESSTIRLIVDNLIVNAVKYTPESGRVVVRAYADGDEAVFEVQDTGIGIDAQHLDRIFERFYRVDKARSREIGGTGLGLAIVKHASGVLGGRAEVESEVGVGSTFRVRLPLSD